MFKICSYKMDSLKRIIQRKQNKLAIDDYLSRQRLSLEQDLRQMLQELDKRTVVVNLSGLPEGKPIHGICISRRELPDAKVQERVILEHITSGRTKLAGNIVSVTSEAVKIKLEEPLTIKKNENGAEKEYRIRFSHLEVLRSRSEFERALHNFQHASCSTPIQNVILGKYKDLSNVEFSKARVISLPNCEQQLKGAQLAAVEHSMTKRISLIEGVAGSGKTLSAACLAFSMNRYRKRKILMCSPMQSTVDKFVRLLSSTDEITVIKLPCLDKTKPSLDQSNPSEGDECALNRMVNEAIYTRGRALLEGSTPIIRGSLRQEAQFHKFATKKVNTSSSYLRRKIEGELLRKADVVCGTLIQAGNSILEGIKFDMLIIDDMHVASETECLIPLTVKGLKQVTMLSDMRCDIRLARSNTTRRSTRRNSLGVKRFSRMDTNSCPNMLNYKSKRGQQMTCNSNSGGDLFERWLSMGLATVALKTQFRMHETIAAFPNHHFYLSRLKTDSSTNENLTRQICSDLVLADDRFSWLPNSKCLTAIFDTSLTNKSTDEVVREIVDNLVLKEHVNENRIGVLGNCPLNTCQNLQTGVKVGSVNNFFGLEKDFIVLSCLEATKETKLSTIIDCDFLESSSALSIAITRARLGLFIVADLSNLTNNKASTSEARLPQTEYCRAWCSLVKYYKANKLIK